MRHGHSFRRLVHRALWMVWLTAGLASAPASAQPRTLVADGASDYEIVVAPRQPAAQLAAEELQRHLAAATGVSLPIVDRPSRERRHLFVGDSPAVRALGVKVEGLPPESLLMRTVDADIVLTGVDVAFRRATPYQVSPRFHMETGTMSAVYAFLEQVVGVRWYGIEDRNRDAYSNQTGPFDTDDLYTLIPTHRRLVVPDLEQVQTPAFNYRLLEYSPRKALRYIAGRRWRLGASMSIEHAHNWFAILPPEKYADHPEYFAQVNGERRLPRPDDRNGWQVCTAHPKVIELFAEAALAFFRANPDRNMFSISPNDGVGFCECDACTALDVEKFPADTSGFSAGRPVLTDRMLTFYNAVAERVAAQMPDRYLGAYIYSFYTRPPKRVVKAHPNLVLFVTLNSAWTAVDEAREQADLRKATAWAPFTERIYLYEMFYWMKQTHGFIQPATMLAPGRIRQWRDRQIRGTYSCVYPAWELGGATAYLLGKLLWNPDVDAAAVTADYYRGMYGPAEQLVREYYEQLESRWRVVLREDADPASLGPVAAFYLTEGKNQEPLGRCVAMLTPILDESTNRLDRAAQGKLDSRQAERLRRLRDYHDLMAHTVTGLNAAAGFLWRDAPAEGALERFRAAVEKRTAVLERIAVYNPDYVQEVRELDDTACNPMVADGGPYHLAGALLSGPAERVLANVHPNGGMENPIDDATWRKQWLDIQSVGGAEGLTWRVTEDMAFEGRRSLALQVSEEARGGLISIRLPQVKGHQTWQVRYRFRAAELGRWWHGTDSPMTRARLRVADQDKTQVLTWTTNAAKAQDQWQLTSLTFRTPAEVQSVVVQLIFQCPGRYWVDDLRVSCVSNVGR